MARARRWTWQKQGQFNRHLSFHLVLPSAVTLSSADAELHKETAPGIWEDVTAQVTITATVEAALDPDTGSAVTGGTDRGVRVKIEEDPDTQPDSTDDPVPGPNYRVMVIPVRSDNSEPLARPVDLTINP